MLIRHIYSITIQSRGDTTRFLKSLNTKISDKKTTIILKPEKEESISYLGTIIAYSFEELDDEYNNIINKYKLSLEYEYNNNIFLKPYNQLHSGLKKDYNQLITHNDNLKLNLNPSDLLLRKANSKDFGKFDWKETIKNNINLIIKLYYNNYNYNYNNFENLNFAFNCFVNRICKRNFLEFPKNYYYLFNYFLELLKKKKKI